jgi:hypothetical protein
LSDIVGGCFIAKNLVLKAFVTTTFLLNRVAQ